MVEPVNAEARAPATTPVIAPDRLKPRATRSMDSVDFTRA